MTTPTLNLEALTLLLDCHDEDGDPTSISITISDAEEGGYAIEATEDGDVIDCDLAATLDEARVIQAEMASHIRIEDCQRDRQRIADAREYAREALMGTAEELSGEAQAAAKLLGLLVGAGRAGVALAALRRIATR